MHSRTTIPSNQSVAHNLLMKSIAKVCKLIEKQQYALKVIEEVDYVAADASPEKMQVSIIRNGNQLTNSMHSRITASMNQSKQSNYSYSRRDSRIAQQQVQVQLNQKARQFVNKLRNRKKEIQGKFRLKKIEEQGRRRQIQRKLALQQNVQKQIQRQIRRLKAENNIAFFQEKKKMFNRNSSSLSPTRRRGDSVSLSTHSRQGTLPSIYGYQLQQIKQEPFDKNETLSADKTVLKRGRKDRSKTQANMHEPDNQIQLFNLKGSTRSRRSFQQELRQYKQRERQQEDEDKKCYLMSRNQTEDISMYLDKFTNMNQLKNLRINLSERNKRSPQKTMKMPILSRQSLVHSAQLEYQEDSQY